VSVPKLWLEERWTSMLDTIQGGVMVVIIVTLFWYGVGRWLDRQFGLYAPATWPGNKYSIFLSGMGLVLFGTIGVRFLWADAELVSRLSACAWCLFACWALATHIRRCWPVFRRQFEK
jgi:ABC-type Fe3+ transport system permease subunit